MTNLYFSIRKITAGVIQSLGSLLEPYIPTSPQRIFSFLSLLGRIRREALNRFRNFSDHVKLVDEELPALIVRAVQSLGINTGDAILVLIDEEALTAVESKGRKRQLMWFFRRDIIKFFEDIVGEKGTLIFPCDSLKDPKGYSFSGQIYDANNSSATGISGVFQNYKGVVKSRGPLLSVAAKGSGADWLVSGHLDAAPYPMGQGSPWTKMLEKNVKVVVIGWGRKANIPILMNSHTNSTSYERPVFFNKPHSFLVLDDDQNLRDVAFYLHARKYGPEYDLSKYGEYHKFSLYLQEKYGLYSTNTLRGLSLAAYSLKDQYEAIQKENNNGVFLEDVPYWSRGA